MPTIALDVRVLSPIVESSLLWQTIGPPEIRSSVPLNRLTPFGERTEPRLELAPSLDELERFLARLFLRRHITWCARRRRFAQMQGAARLSADI
jgi:hypothetical protein